MNRDFRLLVFDWDGTLMDSEARILSCVRAAARDLGLETPADAAIRNIIGLGLQEAVQMLFPGLEQSGVAAVIDRYRHHYLHADETPSELFPGSLTVLRELESREYLLAVETGKGRRGLQKVLNSTRLEHLFHATRCADETFSKPHPQMLLEILDELGVEADEALMIGDTEYDLEMAGNAGVRSVAVGYGAHEPERLAGHGPLTILEDIADLIGWLDEGERANRSPRTG